MLKTLVRVNRRMSGWLAARWPNLFGAPRPGYLDEIRRRIEETIARNRPAAILEAGGVDRPILSRTGQYHFVGLDIDYRPECINLYDEFIVESIENPIPIQVDMVVSFTLLEHVPDNRRAMEAIFSSLRAGGTMHHYIPSALHPYSLVLRLVGPRMQKLLIPILRPGTEDVTGYPTYFDHCTPSRMERLLREQGFERIDILPYYRANDYFAFFLPAYLLVSMFEDLCRWLGIRSFASGFVVSAAKPGTVLT